MTVRICILNVLKKISVTAEDGISILGKIFSLVRDHYNCSKCFLELFTFSEHNRWNWYHERYHHSSCYGATFRFCLSDKKRTQNEKRAKRRVSALNCGFSSLCGHPSLNNEITNASKTFTTTLVQLH